MKNKMFVMALGVLTCCADGVAAEPRAGAYQPVEKEFEPSVAPASSRWRTQLQGRATPSSTRGHLARQDEGLHPDVYDRGGSSDEAAASKRVSVLGPSLVGQWDGPYDWPVVAIHAFMLPTGKVLQFSFPGNMQKPAAYVWDPVTWQFTPVPVDRPLFCSGHSFLADGRLLVTGGNGPAPAGEFRGIKDAHIFDPFSETWTRIEDMADGRWYPTNVTLADGRVLVLSGLDELTGETNADVELYDPSSPTGWELVAQEPLPLYPMTYVLSSGDVFYSGPSALTGVYEIGSWSWYGITENNYGGRYGGMSVALPERQDTVMIIGGQNGGIVTETAEIIDLTDPTPAWQYTQSMSFPRMHANAVILPDGRIFVAGGHSDMHEGRGGGGGTPVYEAEMFDPATETWSIMAPLVRPRMYHSTAVLLPDARVLLGGTDGEFTTEIYSPPYLFRGPRPVITGVPAHVPYGNSFEIQTPDAFAIDSVVLMRLASVTHSVDMDQRYVALDFLQSAGPPSKLLADAPASPNLAPPGYYMLFLINADGVPSIAEMVRLGSAAGGAIPTVSAWGMVVMMLLVLTVGTIVLGQSGKAGR